MPLISRLAATSTIVLAALQAHAAEQVAGRILIADAMTGQVILDNGDVYHFKNPRVLLGLAPGETISIRFEDTGDVPVALGFQRRANKPGTEPMDRPLWRADGGDGNSNGSANGSSNGNSNGHSNGSSNGGANGSSNGGYEWKNQRQAQLE